MSNSNDSKNETKGRDFYDHKPIREFKASISKNGKFWLFKDITTHIVPRKYVSKIDMDFNQEQVADSSSGDQKAEQRNA